MMLAAALLAAYGAPAAKSTWLIRFRSAIPEERLMTFLAEPCLTRGKNASTTLTSPMAFTLNDSRKSSSKVWNAESLKMGLAI